MKHTTLQLNDDHLVGYRLFRNSTSKQKVAESVLACFDSLLKTLTKERVRQNSSYYQDIIQSARLELWQALNESVTEDEFKQNLIQRIQKTIKETLKVPSIDITIPDNTNYLYKLTPEEIISYREWKTIISRVLKEQCNIRTARIVSNFLGIEDESLSLKELAKELGTDPVTVIRSLLRGIGIIQKALQSYGVYGIQLPYITTISNLRSNIDKWHNLSKT